MVAIIIDELEISQSCVRTPAAELLEPAAIKLCYYMLSAMVVKIEIL